MVGSMKDATLTPKKFLIRIPQFRISDKKARRIEYFLWRNLIVSFWLWRILINSSCKVTPILALDAIRILHDQIETTNFRRKKNAQLGVLFHSIYDTWEYGSKEKQSTTLVPSKTQRLNNNKSLVLYMCYK